MKDSFEHDTDVDILLWQNQMVFNATYPRKPINTSIPFDPIPMATHQSQYVNNVHQSSSRFDCPSTLLQHGYTMSDPEVG